MSGENIKRFVVKSSVNIYIVQGDIHFLGMACDAETDVGRNCSVHSFLVHHHQWFWKILNGVTPVIALHVRLSILVTYVTA
jgi:hypothetical protein